MRRRGLTLVELLVAMSVFSVLGLSLMVILRGGLQTWRRSEAKRQAYDQAQAVFLQLQEDLSSAIGPEDPGIQDATRVEARLLCDLEPDTGKARLFLVRSLKAESEHPITGLAGGVIGATRVVDQRDDLAEARAARLRATGGAMEVAWVLGADGVLYRGVKAPAGPPGSLFDAVVPYDVLPLPAPGQAAQRPVPPPPGAVIPLLRPYATDVIHVGFRFWTQHTTTWSTDHPTLLNPPPELKSGPLQYWDSTRAVLEPEDTDPERFQLFRSGASLDDPTDDLFPRKILIELVFREPAAARSSTLLLEPVDAEARELRIEDPSRLTPDGGFAYMGGEWIRYDALRGNRVRVSDGGRGARGTTPRAHDGSDPLEVGKRFELVLSLPSHRDDWGGGS